MARRSNPNPNPTPTPPLPLPLPLPLTRCGETLSSMQYFLFSPVGAYIGVCSYAGSVAAGASLERALEPEPSKLMMHWKPSAYELLEACERERAGAQRAGA